MTTRSPSQGNRHHVDAHDVNAVAAVLSTVKPSAIFHLAGVVHSPVVADYYQANVLFASTLLSAAPKCPVLLVGSGAEYGLVQDHDLPITEETPTRPYNHYGASKLAQTTLGQVAAREGLRVVVVRPFNIIGPDMPEYISVKSFTDQIVQISRGGRPAILETGNLAAVRDFIDVEDVVSIYANLIFNEKAYGQVFNLCSGQAVTMQEIVNRLIAISGQPIKVVTNAKRLKVIDVPRHFGSAEKLQNLIGVQKLRTLDETLKIIFDSAIERRAEAA